ncbi:shikimate dehydrogenase [Thiotrichales bacterium 19S3-7]|nr:shikimate dehydrogenase [Thiotrichales bacterium 19S3-7]MCF6801648.1 shikimate dehydrogenase [Thiotrichales bacterium 19S3-11]
MTKKDQYYVIGYPVKHSLSPKIHTAFAQETHQNLTYDFLEVAPSDFIDTIKALQQDQHIKGLSITVPFKEEAFKLCQDADKYAKQVKAVSNISFDDNRNLYGYNLDGYALILDLKSKGINLANKKILILGAGGAARGCLLPIINQQPKSIYLLNRTEKKAKDLIKEFIDIFTINLLNMNKIDDKFDIIINATSSSLSHQLPMVNKNFVMTKKTIGYDLAYAIEDTPFIKWMKECDCHAYDGTGMLYALSKEIFSIWRNVEPKSNPLVDH